MGLLTPPPNLFRGPSKPSTGCRRPWPLMPVVCPPVALRPGPPPARPGGQPSLTRLSNPVNAACIGWARAGGDSARSRAALSSCTAGQDHRPENDDEERLARAKRRRREEEEAYEEWVSSTGRRRGTLSVMRAPTRPATRACAAPAPWRPLVAGTLTVASGPDPCDRGAGSAGARDPPSRLRRRFSVYGPGVRCSGAGRSCAA